MQSFSSMLAESLAPKRVRSLAIGKFDGLHLGHRRLLDLLGDDGAVLIIDRAVYGCASANDAQDLHPENLSMQNLHAQNLSMPLPQNLHAQSQSFLTSLQDRLLRLPQACAVELASVAHMSGEEFIATLLEALPSLERIVVGYDFRFGRDRLYGAYDLQHLCGQSAQGRLIQVCIVPKVCYGEIPLHASVIKDFVRHGDIGLANAMLGWRYAISGEVVRGQGVGHRELVPTINLRVRGYVLPANGVYATRVDGRNAVSFFGHRVSTDGAYAIESHIIDEHIATPPAQMRIQIHKKIRENRRFDSLSELRAQIERDIKHAQEILGEA